MRRELLFLWEILESIDKIWKLFELDQWDESDVQCDSVMWCFTVIGEAVSQLSTEFKAEYPHVDWVNSRQLRNRVVHSYWSVDFERLRKIASQHLPQFRADIAAIWVAVSGGTAWPEMPV